jgi:hypothetical protein
VKNAVAQAFGLPTAELVKLSEEIRPEMNFWAER